MKIYTGYGPTCDVLKFDTFKFSGGEIQVRINSSRIYKGLKHVIEQYVKSSDDFMELLLATDALRRLGVKKIELKIPYFPYARQDRVCYPGEALSVKVMTDIINAQNYSKVVIFDPHSDVTPALINNCEIVTSSRFVEETLYKIPSGNIILVSPDAGASKKVLNISKSINILMVEARKIRDTKTGEILRTEVNIPPEYADKDFLIVDDICDGGRTFVELAKELKNFTSGKIYLYVTHGIFSKGFEVFNGLIDHIFVAYSFTDNLPSNVTVINYEI